MNPQRRELLATLIGLENDINDKRLYVEEVASQKGGKEVERDVVKIWFAKVDRIKKAAIESEYQIQQST